MEYVTNNQPDATSDPQESADELSFCNCENNACETPYQAEDIVSAIKAQSEPPKKKRISDECRRIGRICRTTASRIKADWKQTDGGPYLKQSASYRLELYKDRDSDTPVDRFSVEKTNTCALRTLLLAAAGTVATMCVLGCIASGKKKE